MRGRGPGIAEDDGDVPESGALRQVHGDHQPRAWNDHSGGGGDKENIKEKGARLHAPPECDCILVSCLASDGAFEILNQENPSLAAMDCGRVV